MIKPASCTPPATAGSAPASAGHQHSQPARPCGLLEPYAAMSGTYGSQGAPDERSSGATRRREERARRRPVGQEPVPAVVAVAVLTARIKMVARWLGCGRV